MSQQVTVRLTVNGEEYERTVPARKTAADFLREDLELTGTHLGCEHGVCGACTVLVDGVASRSCLMYAPQLSGANVQTVEGLAGPDGKLGLLQRAFCENSALQCGFCTPGFLMTATEFLNEWAGRSGGEPGDDAASPTEAEIREAIGGNLCRCTGYEEIVRAIGHAARSVPRSSPAPAD